MYKLKSFQISLMAVGFLVSGLQEGYAGLEDLSIENKTSFNIRPTVRIIFTTPNNAMKSWESDKLLFIAPQEERKKHIAPAWDLKGSKGTYSTTTVSFKMEPIPYPHGNEQNHQLLFSTPPFSDESFLAKHKCTVTGDNYDELEAEWVPVSDE